jgi:tRNA dimethylallyltransferase
MPRLWVLAGATGTGKTALSLALAEHLIGTGTPAEIVNADAMQVYRGMDIGTAKLPASERRGIAHHLFDVLEVTDEAAVAWYQDAARAAISRIHAAGADALLVGGSGLYVSSVVYDFRFPPHDEQLRRELEAELERSGPGALYERLRDRDPVTAERIDPKNGRRIVRAMEVLGQGLPTHGAMLPERPNLWCPDTRFVGVHVDRADLVPRLDARVRGMWDAGLLDEVRELRTHGLDDGVTARRAIGYAQAIAELDGKLDREEAIAQTQALTRRYARRQVSWFRRYEGLTWVDPDASPRELIERAA